MSNESSHPHPTGINKPKPRDGYDEIFAIEIECWCHGFKQFEGTLTPGLVHRVIRELAPVIRGAVLHDYIFNILEVSEQISQACGRICDVREVAFSILLQLPVPFDLEENAQFVLAQVIDQAEQTFGPILSILEDEWKSLRTKKLESEGTKPVPMRPGAVRAPIS